VQKHRAAESQPVMEYKHMPKAWRAALYSETLLALPCAVCLL